MVYKDERFAPPGHLWVCGACGKTATDQYGIEGEHSLGWDESCAMNSSLHPLDKLVFARGPHGAIAGARVIEIKP